MDAEIRFVLNTFSFLVWGGLVMWMCAGFTMLEAGSVRTRNASVICLKNVGLYSIACLTFYLVGYNMGTLAVCIAGEGDPQVQVTGIVAVGAFVFGVSLLIWRLIDVTLGARISARVEEHGQDFAELGIDAFPEFMLAEDDRHLP